MSVPTKNKKIAELEDRLAGSLLFDPEEKSILLSKLTPTGSQALTTALDREDELLRDALAKDGPRVMRTIERYVTDLTAASYTARKTILKRKENEAQDEDLKEAAALLGQPY